MLEILSTASPSGQSALYEDLTGVANWLEGQKVQAHYPLPSAQSVTSGVHPLDYALLPRAVSAFPLARQPTQPCTSKCNSAREGPGESRSTIAADRPYSSGDRLQNLKRRQQVLHLTSCSSCLLDMPLAVLVLLLYPSTGHCLDG